MDIIDQIILLQIEKLLILIVIVEQMRLVKNLNVDYSLLDAQIIILEQQLERNSKQIEQFVQMVIIDYLDQIQRKYDQEDFIEFLEQHKK